MQEIRYAISCVRTYIGRRGLAGIVWNQLWPKAETRLKPWSIVSITLGAAMPKKKEAAPSEFFPVCTDIYRLFQSCPEAGSASVRFA